MKRNVLFLAEELRVGGAETYFYTLENKIDRAKINFYSMAVEGKEKGRLHFPNLYTHYSFSYLDRYKKVSRLCQQNNISVIHVNSLRLAFIAAAIKRKYKVKVIYTRHNITILEKISQRLYALFLNHGVDIVNVICKEERRYLERLGVDKDKIRVIYNGVLIEKFPFSEMKPDIDILKIGILARLDKVKNHILFIDIAKKIHEVYPNTQFYIGGDGPEKKKVQHYIREKGCCEFVKMCGYVDAYDFLSKMDYSMLVSQREVLPISIIEAMAVGCIVIAKNVGGVSELVDDSTGYLIQGEAIDSYLNAFGQSVVSENENDKRMAARNKVEHFFSLDRILNQIQDMYME